eukprot:CAMPEP_0114140680 /NCGR_PEP_ID=MMETSP0043_2-20121206/17511_1 /TAXON_ID=464988 /ORGANISM="Hemiselmis andersenii, Strain CCMP644" /LENGTH=152 /DNA_ID=CAMNT_0001234785 /DNA_START=144 /DNA_END=600 /DNA_ORIENTATION=-
MRALNVTFPPSIATWGAHSDEALLPRTSSCQSEPDRVSHAGMNHISNVKLSVGGTKREGTVTTPPCPLNKACPSPSPGPDTSAEHLASSHTGVRASSSTPESDRPAWGTTRCRLQQGSACAQSLTRERRGRLPWRAPAASSPTDGPPSRAVA